MAEMQIVPAVIPQSYDDLVAALAHVNGAAKTAHIDVCDGAFVPSKSWPLSGDTGKWPRLVAQDEGLPLWERFEFEFDLMVAQPLQIARECVEAGAARVILHLEAAGTAAAFEALKADGRTEVWLAGGVDLDLAPHLALVGRADGFQQMGIRKIGYQGQPFDGEALDGPGACDGVRAVRAAYPDLPISVDGGVSAATAAEIAAAGATKLVAGSAVTGAENPADAAREILEAARG
jgi:ribulose-phosphate 3-epimerase